MVGYKNLLAVRKQSTEDFFEMMDEHLRMNRSCECLIMDYNSDDGIKEYLESYRSVHIPVVPYLHQYLNLPKCYNKAITLAKNNIIGSIGCDFRFTQHLIDGVIDLYKVLGEITLRVLMIKLNKQAKPTETSFSPYFLWKENIIASGGYDERMSGWGKEEDDIIERIFKYQKILEIHVRNLQYFHVWHNDDFRNQYDHEEILKNPNAQIMVENINTNGKNLINSYWKREK